MSIVWHVGDTHLDHRLITKYRKVSSAEENNELMVDMIVTKTKKRDVLWLHGDIFFSDKSVYEYAPVISMNVGQVNYILGNHDLQKLPIEKRKLAFQFLLDLGWNIHGIVKHNGMWLSHAPIHPDELRGKLCCHGHCHLETIPDDRYINVSVDNTNFQLVNRQDILKGWRTNL